MIALVLYDSFLIIVDFLKPFGIKDLDDIYFLIE